MRRPITRYRTRFRDGTLPLTFNRPYRVTGRGVGHRPGLVVWDRRPRRALMRNAPDPRLTGELLLRGITEGI